MKICPKCGKKWQDEFNICPLCGAELLPEEAKNTSVSLGNSNAVSGGIHATDDHSIKNDSSVSASHNATNSHNTTTTNTTNNVYNGNVTHIEREKTAEELLKERKLKYREACKSVLKDGLLTAEERIWLEEQRVTLDLSAEMASYILKEVSNTHQRTVMSMGTVQRIQFNNLKRAVEGNMVQNIQRLLPQIKVIATKFQEEELQFYYHMVLAALAPQECIDAYTQRKEDKYWLTFWTYVALHKLGDVANAENTMIDLGKWQGLMPDENLVILGALGSLIEGDKETASELYMQAVTGEHSPLLANLTEVIVSLINYEPDNTDIIASIIRNRFYVDSFLRKQFDVEINRFNTLKEEEERKRQEEEERKRKQEEERRRQEEEARKEAEERRRKFEMDQKRKEEERKRQEEEERKRKEEEERQKRIQDQERRIAEAKAKQEAEERVIRKAQEEARRAVAEKERLRKEEEARKEAEERRRRFEMSPKRQVEDTRQATAKPRFCRMCGNPLKPGVLFCNQCGTKIL